MYLVFTASKDTYITNKILSPTSRATDANLGGATTIDLFKLFDESIFTGESEPIEPQDVPSFYGFIESIESVITG